MLLLRCRSTDVWRLRSASSASLGRTCLGRTFLGRTFSDWRHLDDLQDPKSVVLLESEEKIFKQFEHLNRNNVKKIQNMMLKYQHTSSIGENHPEVCGAYEYYHTEDVDDKCQPDIYRRLRNAPEKKVQQNLPKSGPQNVPDNVFQKAKLVLDMNHLVIEIPNMMSLSKIRPSMDHNLLAFNIELNVDTDQTPHEDYFPSVFYVKNVSRSIICKLDLSKALECSADASFIPNITDFEWAVNTGGHPVLYLVLNDELIRPCRVVRVDFEEINEGMFPGVLKNIPSYEPKLREYMLEKKHMHEVVYEKDAAFVIDVGRSKDDKFMIISHQSKVSSEVSITPIPVTTPYSDEAMWPATLTPRQRGLKYYVDHAKGHFIVATNRPSHAPSSSSPSSSSSSASPEAEAERDLWIVRSPSIAALNQSMTDIRSKKNVPHPFADWDVIYPVPQDNTEGLVGIEAREGKEARGGIEDRVGREGCFGNIISDFDIFKEKLLVYGRNQGTASVHIVDLKRRQETKETDESKGTRESAGSETTKTKLGKVGENSVDLQNQGPGSLSLAVTDFTPAIAKEVGSGVFQITVGTNDSYDLEQATFTVSNPIVPEMSFSVDLKTGILRKVQEPLLRGERKDDTIGKLSSKYSLVTEHANSNGTMIPITIVFNNNTCNDNGTLRTQTPTTSKSIPNTDPNASQTPRSPQTPTSNLTPNPGPMVLIGYGAYGVSVPVEYDAQVFTLLERGFSVGFAHCRGGGEYGAAWHAGGRGLSKRNTFEDYARCAEHLIASGYTSPSQLCGVGSSAGGLVMGVMANEYPQLFAALIMSHPFLDPYNTIQHPELPLVIHEYDEFGHPEESDVLQNILSFSPCSNIKEQSYPALFIVTGEEDEKVGPWESFKYVTLVRDMQKRRAKRISEEGRKSGEGATTVGGTIAEGTETVGGSQRAADYVERPVLLRMMPNTGHDGPSDDNDAMKQKALEILFMEMAVKPRQ